MTATRRRGGKGNEVRKSKHKRREPIQPKVLRRRVVVPDAPPRWPEDVMVMKREASS